MRNDQNLTLGNLTQKNIRKLRQKHLLPQRRGHLVRQGACHDHAIGLSRAGPENNPEPVEVVARSSRVHHLHGAAGQMDPVRAQFMSASTLDSTNSAPGPLDVVLDVGAFKVPAAADNAGALVWNSLGAARVAAACAALGRSAIASPLFSSPLLSSPPE
jgi:hypothetical protein